MSNIPTACILKNEYKNNFEYSPPTKSDTPWLNGSDICQIPNVDNENTCSLYCSNYDGCKGFNYVTKSYEGMPIQCTNDPGNPGNPLKCCMLKNDTKVGALPSGLSSSDHKTGILTSVPVSHYIIADIKDAKKQYKYIVTTDSFVLVDGKPTGPYINSQIIGGDYEGELTGKSVSNFNECKQLCNSKDDCTAYNYIIPTSKNPYGKVCPPGIPCCIIKNATLIETNAKTKKKTINLPPEVEIDVTAYKDIPNASYGIKEDILELPSGSSFNWQGLIIAVLVIFALMIGFFAWWEIQGKKKMKLHKDEANKGGTESATIYNILQ